MRTTHTEVSAADAPLVSRSQVTFLFSDIEGSTALLHELGEGYVAALAAHSDIMRAAIADHGGTEVNTWGDAFFAIFERASDALGAAQQAQERLSSGPVSVRMGIHEGEALLTSEGLVGMDVHMAARICSAAHGGQVLVSARAADAAGGEMALSELGAHRLKDIGEPQRLLQLGTARFPPLRTRSHQALPMPATAFVGREREVREVASLLGSPGVRIVTIVGLGGIGKTRLALRAAASAAEACRDGAVFVDLGTVDEPAMVLTAVARAVGLRQVRGPLQPALREHLRELEMVLLLDNAEHVVDGLPAVAGLLSHAPDVRLLITSRAATRLAGEHLYVLPVLREEEAVELFTQRARTSDPRFEPDDATRQLCRRLDGLPLALELAAARIRLLPPVQMLKRLKACLDVLSTGPRDVPARQQSLHAALDWSLGLLEEDQRRVVHDLAVFAGGFDLEAAEAVADADLDQIGGLLDRSLISPRESVSGAPRLGLLEIVRDHLRDQAGAEGAERVQERYADYFLTMAERLAPEVRQQSHGPGARQLEDEHANLLQVLRTASDRGDSATLLRMSVALADFWHEREYHAEAARWLETALTLGAEAPAGLRARAHSAAARAAAFTGRPYEARDHLLAALGLFQELGDDWGMARTLRGMGAMAQMQLEHETAIERLTASLELFRKCGDAEGERVLLHMLGQSVGATGDHERARELLLQSMDLARAAEHTSLLANAITALGDLAIAEDDDATAASRFLEVVELGRAEGLDRITANGLAGLAAVASRTGMCDLGGRLWGAVEAALERGDVHLLPHDRERWHAPVDDSCPRTAAAVGEGRSLTIDMAVAEARAVVPSA